MYSVDPESQIKTNAIHPPPAEVGEFLLNYVKKLAGEHTDRFDTVVKLVNSMEDMTDDELMLHAGD